MRNVYTYGWSMKPQSNRSQKYTTPTRNSFKIKLNKTLTSTKVKFSKLKNKTKKNLESRKYAAVFGKSKKAKPSTCSKSDPFKVFSKPYQYNSDTFEPEVYRRNSSSTLGNDCTSVFFTDRFDCHSPYNLNTQSSYCTADSKCLIFKPERMNMTYTPTYTATAPTASAPARPTASAPARPTPAFQEFNFNKKRLVFDNSTKDQRYFSNTGHTTNFPIKDQIKKYFSKPKIRSMVHRFKAEFISLMLMHAFGIIILTWLVVQRVKNYGRLGRDLLNEYAPIIW